MKTKVFPNYWNFYTRLGDTRIKLCRSTDGGATSRFITVMNYDSKEACDKAWAEECGA